MTSIHTQQEVTTMEKLTDERLAELRTIADTATPGPWHWDKSKYHEDPHGFHQDDQPLVSSHDGQWSEVLGSSGYDASSTEASSEDRAHIAAFDPTTVLALLDAARERDGYRESLRVTGNALEEVVAERDELQRRLDACGRAVADRDELQERLRQSAALREVEMWREEDAE